MADEKQQAEESTQIQIFSANASALSTASVNDKVQFLRKMGEYVGAETIDPKSIINVPIRVRGVIIHEATVNQGDKINPATGAVEPNYINADRTVFKLDDGKTLGFVSISIASYVRQYLIPLFGMGDWVTPDGEPIVIEMKVTLVSAKGGQAYNVQVL